MNHRWRVGRKLGRTLYRDEQCVGMVDTPEIAADIINALDAKDRLAEVAKAVNAYHNGPRRTLQGAEAALLDIARALGEPF